jgi:hypothetical protein
MIRVCSGNNAAAAGTNYLLGVATTFDTLSQFSRGGELYGAVQSPFQRY